MKRNSVKHLCRSGIIAALYTVLTLLSAALGLSSGPVQLRLSEALCVLPVFTSAGVPGLFLGCLLSNAVTGCTAPDIIFGSLASLVGALGTRVLRNREKVCLLPPVAANVIAVPLILRYAYGIEKAFALLVLGVAAGEFISVWLLGTAAVKLLNNYPALKKMISDETL